MPKTYFRLAVAIGLLTLAVSRVLIERKQGSSLRVGLPPARD